MITKRVRTDGGILKVFCSECNQWREILIKATGYILFYQRLVLEQISDCHSLVYICGACSTEISHLLSEKQRWQLIKETGIPLARAEVERLANQTGRPKVSDE